MDESGCSEFRFCTKWPKLTRSNVFRTFCPEANQKLETSVYKRVHRLQNPEAEARNTNTSPEKLEINSRMHETSKTKVREPAKTSKPQPEASSTLPKIENHKSSSNARLETRSQNLRKRFLRIYTNISITRMILWAPSKSIYNYEHTDNARRRACAHNACAS